MALDSVVTAEAGDSPCLLPPHAAALTLWNSAVVWRCQRSIPHAAKKDTETGPAPAEGGH